MNNHGNETAGNAVSIDHTTIDSWLQLLHTTGLGARTFHLLLETFGTVEAIFNARAQQLNQLNLKAELVSAILQAKDNDISADLAWLEHQQHHIISLRDPRYPLQLKGLIDAPPILYVRGDPDYLSQPQLAMVGSRNPSAAGRNTAKEFAQHLADAGITITSGLASGIDGASHEGALMGLAGTVAVVAHGLDIVYPAQHQQLAKQICQHGAVISEMPIGTQLHPGLFPRRNRLISALTLGTLVVEAAQKSGSLITARLAIEQNKEVFAIPGSIHNPMAKGCHQLIREGAKLVETAQDILEELRFDAHNKPYSSPQRQTNIDEKPKDTPQALDPDHQKLLKCLAYEPASIDELVINSEFNAAEIASMLLIMELEGFIVCQDGRYTCVN